MTIGDNPPDTKKYEQAVLAVIRNYGLMMEAFGRAGGGSPRGMESTMRLAQDAAREVLFAALGHEPTLEELAQVPPLHEPPVSEIAVDAIGGEDKSDDEEPTH